MTLENRVSLLDLVNTTNEVVNTVDTEISNIIYRTSYVTKIGNIIERNGVLSGFTNDDYATLPIKFNPGSNSWEIGIKVKINSIPEESTPYYRIINNYIDTNSLGIVFARTTNSTVQLQTYLSSVSGWDTLHPRDYVAPEFMANTVVWFKLIFDKTKYTFKISTNGKDFTTAWTVESSNIVKQDPDCLCLGIGSLNIYGGNGFSLDGEIDLNECYINIDGERFWSGVTSVSSNELADINLSNLANNGKSVITNNAWPSTTYTDLVPTSTAQYKAPADGWFAVGVDTGNSSGNVILFNATKNIANEVHVPSNYTGCGNINIMASKNDMVTLYYPGTPRYFKFIYAEGSK